MKLVDLFSLFIALGLIVTAGCIATTSKNITNLSSNPTNVSLNATPDSTPMVKGSLVVSVTGFLYPSNLSVFLDNRTVGEVNPTQPLYLMVSAGNHTVGVCADFVCEEERVTIRFGKYMTVDFSDRLHKDVVITQPTAQVRECYKNGDSLSIDIEFINPTKKDLQMSAVVSCGYSYVDTRTGLKMGDSTHGRVMQNVKAGQHVNTSLLLNLAKGNSLSYSYPVIEELTVK